MKKFLIVTPQTDVSDSIRKSLSHDFKDVQFVLAQDGVEAQAKIANDPPHLVFIDQNIKKLSAYNLVDWVLKHNQYARMALILLPEIPERELFVDEVLVGKVQFMDNLNNSARVVRFVNRALNFAAAEDYEDYSIRYVSSGEDLIKEGEIGEHVYIVKSGTLEATHLNDKGDTVLLGLIEAGEFVGEMSFVNKNPRSASVKALTQCELIEIPMSRLDHLLFHKPKWSKALINTLTKRLEKANKLLKIRAS